MSSRALSLATVLLLTGFGAADTVLAQATNLEAGKSPSQIFAQTCNACHKSPRGLLKSVPPGSLPSFLRQHYTTSSDMAGVLSSYLVSNGATDTRYQSKDGKDKKDGAKEKEANTSPGQSPEHQGKRQRSQEAAKPEGEAPAGQATPEGRKSKRLGKRGKPEGEEAPKADLGAPAAGGKSEPKTNPKPDTAKVDTSKGDTGEAKADSSKTPEQKNEGAKAAPSASETPALRADPVPPVTPAPPAAAKPAEPSAPKSVEATPAKPAETAPSTPTPEAKPQEAPSAGPPAPPISR